MSAAKLDTLGYLVKFFGNEQGRDKFNKIVQYGARLIAHELKIRDSKDPLVPRFTGLFQHTRDTRKLLRWFKQFAELQKIQLLLKQQPSTKQNLQILGALGLFLYWTFDNLVYLSNAKFLEKNPNWGKLSMLGWNIGITTSIIVDTQSLIDNINKQSKLQSHISTLKTDGSASAVNDTRSKIQTELTTLKKQQLLLTLNLIKNAGDWTVSANGFELLQRFGLSPFSERTVCVGGLISGAIVIYQVYNTL